RVMGKIQDPCVVIMDEQVEKKSYREPEQVADDITGVATIYPHGSVKMDADKIHLLTHASVKSNVPLVYYNGSVWSKANDASAGTSAKQWFKYVDLFNQKLKEPLKVTIQ